MRRYFYKTQPGYDLYCKPISGRDTVKSRPGKTPGGPQMICMNTYSMPFGFYHFESQLAI